MISVTYWGRRIAGARQMPGHPRNWLLGRWPENSDGITAARAEACRLIETTGLGFVALLIVDDDDRATGRMEVAP